VSCLLVLTTCFCVVQTCLTHVQQDELGTHVIGSGTSSESAHQWSENRRPTCISWCIMNFSPVICMDLSRGGVLPLAHGAQFTRML